MTLARINLLLALLVAGLVLAVILLDAPGPGDTSLLTGHAPAEVRHIRIERRGRDTLAFVRDDDGWRMTAPGAAPAIADRLDAIARILSAASRRSFPAAEADLQELGLAPARLSLWLDRIRLDIGGTDPINHRRYLLIGDRVHLIDDLYQHHLAGPADAFIAGPESP